MAFTTTMLAWSVIEFGNYMPPAELRNALVAIRWSTDYLLKTVSQPNRIFVQLIQQHVVVCYVIKIGGCCCSSIVILNGVVAVHALYRLRFTSINLVICRRRRSYFAGAIYCSSARTFPRLSPPATIPTFSSLPQYQLAQQLFQRDAQTITPEALGSVKAALGSSEVEHKAETKKKAVPRKAAGQSWEDPTLADWAENDSSLFCGDLGNEVNDGVLSKGFSRFPSFNMAKVVRDKRTGKTKGYGFL